MMNLQRLIPGLLALALAGCGAPPQDGTPAPSAFQAGDGKKKALPVEQGQLKISGPVLFETGSDALTPESDSVLSEVRDTLELRTDYTLLRIEGHSDNAGNPAASQALTEKRALAVARWLVAKGIDCKRVLPVGFGGTKPVADNSTPAGKAENRRIAFVIASLRGRPLGGLPVDGGGKVAGDPCQK